MEKHTTKWTTEHIPIGMIEAKNREEKKNRNKFHAAVVHLRDKQKKKQYYSIRFKFFTFSYTSGFFSLCRYPGSFRVKRYTQLFIYTVFAFLLCVARFVRLLTTKYGKKSAIARSKKRKSLQFLMSLRHNSNRHEHIILVCIFFSFISIPKWNQNFLEVVIGFITFLYSLFWLLFLLSCHLGGRKKYT